MLLPLLIYTLSCEENTSARAVRGVPFSRRVGMCSLTLLLLLLICFCVACAVQSDAVAAAANLFVCLMCSLWLDTKKLKDA